MRLAAGSRLEKLVSVVGLHGLGTKVAGKMKASSRCELVAGYSRTLMSPSRRIAVHLVRDQLFGLFRIECFRLPVGLICWRRFFTVRGLEKRIMM
jgi:hypothetical protein